MRPTISHFVSIYQRLFSLAPSLRGLRSGTSLSRHDCRNEVLPHCYGTQKKDPSRRTPKSLLSQAHPDNRADPPPAQSGCLGQSGLDGEQLGDAPGISRLCWTPATVVGGDDPSPHRRRGDLSRQSLGDKEGPQFRRVITESDRRTPWGDLFLSCLISYWITGIRSYGGCRVLP